ncbi:MAG: SPOR domain-containing protein [Brevundimonas sp.]|uniref:SPOR domain-containing protein n=1 Tax=Brevundimonas sp. TaxID=1871086 RepID=UPI0040340CE8
MKPSLLIRPVLAIALTTGLGACGMVESDPHRFETWARNVAAIPLDGQAAAPAVVTPAVAPVRTAAQEGLRPALRVEVMSPHDLWDARDGLVQQASARVAEVAAPVVVDAVVREASERIEESAPRLRPAISHHQTSPRPDAARGLVQLGAYSSREAAQAAWSRLKAGGAAWALEGLSPTYEAVQVNGRDLVRLKVRAPGAGAAALCAAAGVDDPWCRRTA